MTRRASGAILGVVAIEIRQVSGYEELERWVATRNEVFTDDTDSVGMKVLLRASQTDRVDLIAYDGGEVVGTGLLAGDPFTQADSHPYVEVVVPEQYRGRGVGTALLREFSDRLRRRGKEGLQVEARADDVYTVAYLERRGFVEVSRWVRLVLDLGGRDALTPPRADGLELTWLSDRPDLLAELHEVALEWIPERTGSFGEWQVYELGDPRIRLDLTAVAVAGDRVVGYATFLALADEGAGWLRTLRLRLVWQGRGVESALTQAQIAAATREGFVELVAWVRPGERQELYESHGFERRADNIDFRGPLL